MGILVNQGKQLAEMSGGLHRLRRINVFEQVRTQQFFGKTQEFDEHRAYAFGDDIRDIDWKATAKTGTLLIKRFLPFKDHSIILVADVGKGMAGKTTNGEGKLTMARYALSLLGIIGLSHNYSIYFSHGDASVNHKLRTQKGEKHLERILEMLENYNPMQSSLNDPISQLAYVTANYNQPSLVVYAAQSPVITEELKETIRILRTRHAILWIICEDLPMLEKDKDLDDAYDILTHTVVFRKGVQSKSLYAEYVHEEQERKEIVERAFKELDIRHIRIGSGLDILPQLLAVYPEKSDR